MFLKDIKLQKFPIGAGGCKFSVDLVRSYNQMLVDIGTAKPINLTEEEAIIFEGLPMVSYLEMVEQLAPQGNPDLIVLSYWMPDPDGSCDSMVSGIRSKLQVDAKQTIALGEAGPGAIFNAIEYVSRAIQNQSANEVWLFFLNQFQGMSPDDGRIFSSAPAVGIWLHIVAEPDGPSPTMRLNRSLSEIERSAAFDFNDVWEKLMAAMEKLAQHKGIDSWHYSYQSEYNKLVFELAVGAN